MEIDLETKLCVLDMDIRTNRNQYIESSDNYTFKPYNDETEQLC